VLFDDLVASLRRAGRDFERLRKWALENILEYHQRLRRVWLWDEWPERWRRNAGIDLLAEEQEGAPWAVQAKHYDRTYAIEKADDSFLSESSRPAFQLSVVIAYRPPRAKCVAHARRATAVTSRCR
jgi:predicted helicase